MAIRIYALAKELRVDSLELVNICSKAGLSGKGSALASLSDDEVGVVRQVTLGEDCQQTDRVDCVSKFEGRHTVCLPNLDNPFPKGETEMPVALQTPTPTEAPPRVAVDASQGLRAVSAPAISRLVRDAANRAPKKPPQEDRERRRAEYAYD